MSGPEPAGPEQAAALAAIHAEAFPPAEAWGEAAIAGLLATPGTAALLCGREGMAMLRVAADEAEILTLAVRPGARRRGLGRALLAAAMAAAAAAGARRMLLEVAEDNAAARALYAAAGFAPVGRRPGYYPGGGDALVLAAALPGG
ncbi:MAG: GNAT family N-acetyltransferase [Acetobacteraceae bacterium]|nr:GNAT family N-acetyltransferase [Acetobacteraceae bacterium]